MDFIKVIVEFLVIDSSSMDAIMVIKYEGNMDPYWSILKFKITINVFGIWVGRISG